MTADEAAVVVPATAPERAVADGRQRSFPCKACGADLIFPPGATELACPYCGAREAIPLTAEAIREYALDDFLPPKSTTGLGDSAYAAFACSACGSTIEATREAAARPCPYCGGTLLASADSADQVRPEAVLPFSIDRSRAEQAVSTWLHGLWFAPNDLKRAVTFERVSSLYLPYWTFDSHTVSHYQGEAGHRYTVSVGSGKHRRTETRIRWEHRSGVHEQFFDDVLIPGGSFRDGAAGYRLDALVPYDTSYLAGHSADRYQQDPQAAWPMAKSRIESRIDAACRRLIGGDTQRNVAIRTVHRGISFKLVMLPRWQAGYRYRGKAFAVLVNGQTAVVEGDRPWSRWKIALAVIAGLVVVALVIALASYGNSTSTSG